jgi:hypothetical protein
MLCWTLKVSSFHLAVIRLKTLTAGTVCHWGCIKPKTKDSVLLKARTIVQGLEAVRDEVEHHNRKKKTKRPSEWVVCVEDFMMLNGTGRSSAKGLFTLAQVNGIVSYESIRLFEYEPDRVYPSKARSFYGLKKTKEQSDIKSVVFEFAKKYIPGPWKLDKHGAIHKDNFDISDAYLIARYSFDQQQQQQLQQQRHPQPTSEVE